jgi:hypothetical protein
MTRNTLRNRLSDPDWWRFCSWMQVKGHEVLHSPKSQNEPEK